MAVRSVCQLDEGWAGEYTTPHSESYTVIYQIIADAEDGPRDVSVEVQNPPYDLPFPNKDYEARNESSVRSRCSRVRCEKISTSGDGVNGESRFLYSCDYGPVTGPSRKDPPPGDVLPGDEEPDPIRRPEREWYEWESSTGPFTHDVNGKPVENSARQLLTEFFGFTIDQANLVHAVMHRWPATYDEEKTALRDMLDAIKLKTNLTEWRGHAPDTVMMRPPAVFGPRYEDQKVYYEVTFRGVVFDPNDINQAPEIAPEDWGTNELALVAPGSGIELPVAITDGGSVISSPVKLSGDGRKLNDQKQLPILLDGTPPKPGPYRRYNSIDFHPYIPDPPPNPQPPAP